jgi:endonuclease/exonuclease/phosphatase family metal-dependent hydrolase
MSRQSGRVIVQAALVGASLSNTKRTAKMGWLCLAVGLSSLRVLGFFTDPLLSARQIHQVIGEPARVERMAADHLEVVTWNIEQGMAYEAILSVLQGLDADVILLQEVDRHCRRTEYRHVARDLAEALDMNWIAAGEFQEIGEGRASTPAVTGQAILSKFRIDRTDVLRFAAQDRWRWSINPVQPRRGGRIALTARTGGLVLYNTHIESGGNHPLKRRQIAEILAHQARTLTEKAPVLIAGDFNNGPLVHSHTLMSFAAARFEDALGDAGQRGRTSLGQAHPIDWIFVKNVAPLRGRVVDSLAASDHFPVIAAFQPTAALISTR